MKNLYAGIFWCIMAVLMLVCIVIDIISGNWIALMICVCALGMDSCNAFFAFKNWAEWKLYNAYTKIKIQK